MTSGIQYFPRFFERYFTSLYSSRTSHAKVCCVLNFFMLKVNKKEVAPNYFPVSNCQGSGSNNRGYSLFIS